MKIDNILIYFVNLVRDFKNGENRKSFNPNFLKFFRTICSFQKKGVSVNQETLYKFIENLPGFEQALFIYMDLDPK